VTLADTPTMELVERCHMVLVLAVMFALPSRKANASVEISAVSPTRAEVVTLGAEATSSAAADLLCALLTRRVNASVAQAADFLMNLMAVIAVLLPTLAPTTAEQLVLAMLSNVESVIVATPAAFLTVAMVAEWVIVVLLAFATNSRLENAREVILADILTILTPSSVLL